MIADDQIPLYEYAARFIVSKDNPLYVLDETGVSANAGTFMPDEVNTVLETSIFLHRTKDDIPWEEGARAFNALKPDGSVGKRPALAADVPCDAIRSEGLTIDPDDQGGTLPHHANIRAWDINDVALQSARLAAVSRIEVNPHRDDKFARQVRAAQERESGK